MDGQIVYSMWDGYLKPEHAGQALIRFIGSRPYEQLHTSGHVHEAHEPIRSMSFWFHDFWEERHVDIEDLCMEHGQ